MQKHQQKGVVAPHSVQGGKCLVTMKEDLKTSPSDDDDASDDDYDEDSESSSSSSSASD